MDDSSTTQTTTYSAWETALEQSRRLSLPGDAHLVFTKGPSGKTEGPEELLAHIERLASTKTDKVGGTLFSAFQQVLVSVVDFIAILAWILFVNGNVVAAVPGLLWLAIMVRQPILPEALLEARLLREDLGDLFEYEEWPHKTPQLERALVEVYSELILFYLHSVDFVRVNAGGYGRVKEWCWSKYSLYCSVRRVRDAVRAVDDAAGSIVLPGSA